jgi:hypothetical protein
MRKLSLLCGIFLCLSLGAAAADDTPSPAPVPDAAPAPAPVDQHPPGYIFSPDRGRVQFAVGYQYQHYRYLGRPFHNNGYNADVDIYLFDWITGAVGRLTVAAEATGVFGFGGDLNVGRPHTNLVAKSLFFGGGPHVAIQSDSRFEPWAHVLPGFQHYRFTQFNSTFGSNNAFGFMAGGGLDVKISRRIYWRIQGDYIFTHFAEHPQNNYSMGTGFVFNY